jgi:hypothetical protein
VEDLRATKQQVTFRAVQHFLDRTFDAWREEFARIWHEVANSWLCPTTTPLPCFLPVVEHGVFKCLRMPAATDEFGSQMLFRQIRMQEGLRSSAARSASLAMMRAASRELARFQARLVWKHFPATQNYWGSDDLCCGIEEKKDLLGVRPSSEIDLWLFDRIRKEVVIGEVKVARFACSVKDLSREYDSFGRGGRHRRQLAGKLRWARSSRPFFALPWGGSAKEWRVRGVVLTNAFPESVWALHHDLPGIAPVGSDKADAVLNKR